MREFFMNPEVWRSFKPKVKLEWKEVKFTPAARSKIPKQRGIYAFIVRSPSEFLPSHGFVMYIGITGDQNSRTLRNRYQDYVREQKEMRRPRLHYLLTKFSKDLIFSYAPIPDPNEDLATLETTLCDAIIPPMNERDLSAEVRDMRKLT